MRVGHRRWPTQVEGVVVDEGRRPVGGIEMGGKASYCQQKTLQLQRDDGELTEVALDEETQVETIAQPVLVNRAGRRPPRPGRSTDDLSATTPCGESEPDMVSTITSSSVCCSSWRSCSRCCRSWSSG